MLCLSDEESMCHPVPSSSGLGGTLCNHNQFSCHLVHFTYIRMSMYIARLIIPRMSLANYGLKVLPEER